MSKYVGMAMKRVEDPRFIQGKGKYVSNLSRPGMVHVAIKRSPHAHAAITAIDTSAAEALPGVVAVYTGQDLVDAGVSPLPCGFTPQISRCAPIALWRSTRSAMSVTGRRLLWRTAPTSPQTRLI